MQKRTYSKEDDKSKKYYAIATGLTIAAILFLIINSIYLEINKQRFVSELKLNPSISLQTIHTVPILIDLICILWIILAAILIFSLFFLKWTKCLWIVILVISIIALATFRIDSFVLGLLAAIFYSRTIKSKY